MNFIDLTQLISSEMPVYPGTDSPKFDSLCTLEKNGFREMKIKNLTTHTGTHIDSPAHLFSEGLTLDKLPLEQFIGPAVVIDCSRLTKGENISSRYITKVKNRLEKVDFVLFYTGWDIKWNQKEYFIDFPVLSIEAVEILIELNLKGVGIDTVSVDPVSSQQFHIHRKLLGKDMIIIENLTNLGKLVNKIFTFSCFPLKITGADGSPVRALARLE